MPSEGFFLPSLRNLLDVRTLNMFLNYLPIRNMFFQEVPTPGQRLDQLVQPSIESIGIMFSSPPEIHVGTDGYECIKGPLNQNQRRIWQGMARGTILKRCPPGNNYIVPKRAPQLGVPFEEAHGSIVCLSPQGRSPKNLLTSRRPTTRHNTRHKAHLSRFTFTAIPKIRAPPYPYALRSHSSQPIPPISPSTCPVLALPAC
ncbi:hypothetical protein IW262DRAFT_475180 [Armillaria fumosa]|nr:hypothetical protein IW262DRAFT_475180 [Armillaria fumosa]